MKSQKIKIIIGLSAGILLLIALFTASLKLDTTGVKEVIRSFGILGPIVLILINAVTIVLSPLISFPLWLASLAIYGFWPTLVLVYIGNNIGNLCAFLIAKYFGRPLVVRFVGANNIRKVDEFVQLVGVKPLFVARLFGGAASDYISYAAGLTNIKAREYLYVNLAAMGPSIFIQLVILEKTISVNPIYITFFIIWGYVAATILTFYLYRKKKQQN